MRIFLAGASGALGTRLVPQLLSRGHEVVGTATSDASAERVRSLGAEALTLDLLEPTAVREAVVACRPEAVVHEATALKDIGFSRRLDASFVETNRLRTEGTDALLAAAREAGARRFVAQSFANFRHAREGGPVKAEDDPLDPAPVAGMRGTAAAMVHLEQSVLAWGGIVLRYGGFYGADNDALIEPVRKRQFPIVGDGGGVSSFIHLDDAAAATVLALDREGPALYNVVDDEPAPVREWLPVLADTLGAKPPRGIPRWLARLVAGEGAVMMGTEARGASNEKAKRELGWTLRYPSWREGFAAVYGPASAGSHSRRRAALTRRSPASRAASCRWTIAVHSSST
jgi:nucleoside-diphosphate-sugar epimerase